MAYVDLNPVRADLAETPEESEFCGAGGPPAGASCEGGVGGVGGVWPGRNRRRRKRKSACWRKARGEVERARWLSPVDAEEGGVLGMSEEGYLRLVDWTGRHLRDDKAGAIPADLAPVLERLELDVEKLAIDGGALR